MKIQIPQYALKMTKFQPGSWHRVNKNLEVEFLETQYLVLVYSGATNFPNQ